MGRPRISSVGDAHIGGTICVALCVCSRGCPWANRTENPMRLADLFHLPALAAAFDRLLAEPSGMILVAGIDLAPPAAEGETQLLPSGRATIFRVLAEEWLARVEAPAALVAADLAAFRVPRAYRQRVSVLRVSSQQSYGVPIERARSQGVGLLLIDHLTPESAAPAIAAAGAGCVLTQCNSGARGLGLARELESLAGGGAGLPSTLWLVSVHRLPMLCPACRRPEPLTATQRLQRARQLEPGGNITYLVAPGCPRCEGRGRSGTVALFDLCRLAREGVTTTVEPVLTIEQYGSLLAGEGLLSFDDVVDLDATLARHSLQQLVSHQQTLDQANQALGRRLAELQSAHQVLQQRTAALVSFQQIGQALLASTDMPDLARRVCQLVRELCGADRAIFYILEEERQARVLAVSGWEPESVGRQVARADLETDTAEPSAYDGWPPGIPPQHADLAGGVLRAGLCVPLIAEQRQVGMLIIHVMSRARFAPAETALLQTFAHQAALLIQRTRLIDELNASIARLRAAQAALVERERLAREMELAAEVQRSILPRVFPRVPGLCFAADARPAREVGGDFYDIFALDATTVGLVIGDVSGKGMAAALYMALTRSLLLAEARREPSPRAVLLNVNRLLREVGDPHMFVSVFYGVLDIPSRALTYARAGHDYPLLLRGERAELLKGTGLVLGILDVEVEQLAEQRTTLGAGDRLVLYTDGLTDVIDERGRRLELPGLLAILQRHRQAEPAELCAATFAALRAYQGEAEQFDDMTMVVVGVGEE